MDTLAGSLAIALENPDKTPYLEIVDKPKPRRRGRTFRAATIFDLFGHHGVSDA